MHSSTTILFFKIPIRQKRKQVKDRSKVDSVRDAHVWWVPYEEVRILNLGGSCLSSAKSRSSEVTSLRAPQSHPAQMPRARVSPPSGGDGSWWPPRGASGQELGSQLTVHRKRPCLSPHPRPAGGLWPPIYRHTFDFKTYSGSPAAIRFYF